MNEQELPLALGDVRGLRVWTHYPIGFDSLLPPLMGAVGGTWRKGENKGYCRVNGTHRAAAVDCTCGYYAYWKPSEAQRHPGAEIMGVIQGYGRTTIGSKGFRCEKARIVAICPVPGRRAGTYSLAAVADYYDVPWYLTVADMLREHPVSGKPRLPWRAQLRRNWRAGVLAVSSGLWCWTLTGAAVPVMVGATVMQTAISCVYVFWGGKKLSRRSGSLFQRKFG